MVKEKLCQEQLTRDPHDKDPFRKKQQLAVSESFFKEKDVEQKLRKAHLDAEALTAFLDKQQKT